MKTFCVIAIGAVAALVVTGAAISLLLFALDRGSDWMEDGSS